jgi:murein DD-endopeptidase MepM/ murein hydrolase activator NlpD
MRKRSKTYTVMIIPDRNGGKSLSLCLSRTSIILFLALFCVLSGSAAIMLVKSAEAAKKLQYFNTLRKDNEYLTKENEQLRLVYQKTARIDSITKYLEKLSSLSRPSVKTRKKTPAVVTKTTEKSPETAKRKKAEKVSIEKTAELGTVEKCEDKKEIVEEAAASIPSVLPVEGWITQHFVEDTAEGIAAHPGIDIAAAEGVTIRAPAAGMVLTIEKDQYYGNLIVIKHDDEFTTRYGHCARILLSEEEKVERGQEIALVGNTGRSTAPHLHYEVIRNGKNVNPLLYIKPKK